MIELGVWCARIGDHDSWLLVEVFKVLHFFKRWRNKEENAAIFGSCGYHLMLICTLLGHLRNLVTIVRNHLTLCHYSSSLPYTSFNFYTSSVIGCQPTQCSFMFHLIHPISVGIGLHYNFTPTFLGPIRCAHPSGELIAWHHFVHSGLSFTLSQSCCHWHKNPAEVLHLFLPKCPLPASDGTGKNDEHKGMLAP